jgi:hypothetical protein
MTRYSLGCVPLLAESRSNEEAIALLFPTRKLKRTLCYAYKGVPSDAE